MLSQQKLKHVLQVARVVECFVGFVFVALGLAVVVRTLLSDRSSSDSSSDELSTPKGECVCDQSDMRKLFNDFSSACKQDNAI